MSKNTRNILYPLLLPVLAVIYLGPVLYIHLSSRSDEVEIMAKQKYLLEKQSEKLTQRQDKLKRTLYRAKTENIVQDLRSLMYKTSPVYREIARNELEAIIHREMEKENPKEKIQKIQRVMTAFGYLDRDFNLYNAITQLYQEQIAGFYDPDRKELFSIKDMPLSGNLQRTILAHELTHVLQDQHFNLKKHLDDKNKSDDEKLALQALVEGDATFITQLFYVKTLNIGVLADIISFFILDQTQFRKTPLVLKENLLFPYLKGTEFISFLFQRGGWEQVNTAFQNPPVSSEQIIHPEKFIAGEPPAPINLPEFTAGMNGWLMIEKNVIGEFNVFILFKKFLSYPLAKIASEGWGGDTFAYLERTAAEKTQNMLVWATAWDTEKDALQFEKIYKKLVAKKAPLIKEINTEIPQTSLYRNASKTIYIERDGLKVLTVEAPDMKTLDFILKRVKTDKL